jgi:hypothetical protein
LNLALPLSTCAPVSSEASYLLGGQSDRLFEMIDLGAYETAPLFPAHTARIRKLLRSYAPRVQLADACLVRNGQSFFHQGLGKLQF